MSINIARTVFAAIAGFTLGVFLQSCQAEEVPDVSPVRESAYIDEGTLTVYDSVGTILHQGCIISEERAGVDYVLGITEASCWASRNFTGILQVARDGLNYSQRVVINDWEWNDCAVLESITRGGRNDRVYHCPGVPGAVKAAGNSRAPTAAEAAR